MELAYIGLGSNLGDREKALSRACALIQAGVGEIKAVSSVYETKALMKPGAPPEFDRDFLNCCLSVQTELLSLALLSELQAIEREIGRTPSKLPWAPRVIDLDILLIGDHISDSEELVLPHPGIDNRQFVLQGLIDIAPDLACPRTGELYRFKLEETELEGSGASLKEYQPAVSIFSSPVRN